MARDEIDALLWLALLALVNIGACHQPVGHGVGSAIVALQERADIVAKLPVPLLPAVANKAADLVETRSVPGFGNQLDVCENRIGLDVPENWRRCHRSSVLVSRQDRREIETKAVDMHLGDPISQAVKNQPSDNWLVSVQRVAAAGEIGIPRFIISEDVIVVIR